MKPRGRLNPYRKRRSQHPTTRGSNTPAGAGLTDLEARRLRQGTRIGSTAWFTFSSIWGAVALIAVMANVDPTYRAPLVLAYVLVFPGFAFVRLLGIPSIAARVSLAVAISLALDVLIPAALVYGGIWSPRAALLILVAVTVVASAVHVLCGSRVAP
jgi:hypothetical protein